MATTILDVSTKEKYRKSHIKGTVNIPYDEINSKLEEIKNMQPVIICCATGELSKYSYDLLKRKGLKEIYNGGNWDTVAFMIQKMTKYF